MSLLLAIFFCNSTLANDSAIKICQGTVELSGVKSKNVPGEEEIEALNNKAIILLNQGDPQAAEEVFHITLSQIKRGQTVSPQLRAIIFNGLGLSLFQQRKFGEAEQAYLQAKEIFDTEHLVNDQLLALVLDNLGQSYRLQGKEEQAEPCYKQALSIEEKLLGPDSQDTAITKCNLGMLYVQKRDYEKAEPYLTEGMSVIRKSLGASSESYTQFIPYYKVILKATGHKSHFPDIPEQ